MTVHVDDLLRILHACSHLVSVKLEELNVVHLGLDTDTYVSPTVGGTHRSPDQPFPLVPILDSNLDQIYSGRQLHKLTLKTPISQTRVCCAFSELIWLLDAPPIPKSLLLIHLSINNNGPTHRSGARILQECSRLEVVDF